jgi:hypothetical protein
MATETYLRLLAEIDRDRVVYIPWTGHGYSVASTLATAAEARTLRLMITNGRAKIDGATVRITDAGVRELMAGWPEYTPYARGGHGENRPQ